jgi:hypothetical protein
MKHRSAQINNTKLLVPAYGEHDVHKLMLISWKKFTFVKESLQSQTSCHIYCQPQDWNLSVTMGISAQAFQIGNIALPLAV